MKKRILITAMLFSCLSFQTVKPLDLSGFEDAVGDVFGEKGKKVVADVKETVSKVTDKVNVINLMRLTSAIEPLANNIIQIIEDSKKPGTKIYENGKKIADNIKNIETAGNQMSKIIKSIIAKMQTKPKPPEAIKFVIEKGVNIIRETIKISQSSLGIADGINTFVEKTRAILKPSTDILKESFSAKYQGDIKEMVTKVENVYDKIQAMIKETGPKVKIFLEKFDLILNRFKTAITKPVAAKPAA